VRNILPDGHTVVNASPVPLNGHIHPTGNGTAPDAVTIPKYKPAEVQAFLEFLSHDSVNGVTELRILLDEPYIEINGRRVYVGKTIVGYYETGQLAKAAKDIAPYYGKANIYVTANPCNPALLARAKNRLQTNAQHSAKDEDILCRLWMLIDCDPNRPSGISSSDSELQAALARRDLIAEYLQGYGAQAIKGMSGNGGHLLVRLPDYPNDAEHAELITKITADIAAAFSDDVVSVDTTVTNAARIWKVYGTLAVKGDSTKERPHRRASIELPDAPPTPFDISVLPVEEPEPAPQLPPISSNGSSSNRVRGIVQSKLRSAVQKIKSAPDNTKHGCLLRCAVWCGGYIHTGEITAEEIERTLYDAVAPRAKDKKKAQRTIRDGIDFGRRKPLEIVLTDSSTQNTSTYGSTTAQAQTITKQQDTPRRYSTDADLDGILADVSWFWRNWIPNGFPTMIAGFGDAGKSTVVQDICKRFFNKQPWPDGQYNDIDPADMKLLWIDTEASQAIFRQRLIDWGMPRGRFILPGNPLHDLLLDNDEDWAWIKGAIEDYRPPLVVIDSLSGSHNKDENSNDGMKPIMKKLAHLAQEYQIAVVIIHHLTKPAPGVPEWPITQPMLRGATSITQYCRSVIGCGTPNKQEPFAHGFMSVKLNLAKKPEPLGYTLTDQGPAWGAVPEVPQPRRAVDDAIDFLKAELKNGVRLSDEINAKAKACSIGYNALCDAKKVLGVDAHREGGKNGRWFLSMPEWAPANDEEGGAV
jgi:AAA domain